MVDAMEINVIKLRERLGLTVDEFAAAIGANRTTVWRWERGETTPHMLYLRAMRELAGKSRR